MASTAPLRRELEAALPERPFDARALGRHPRAGHPRPEVHLPCALARRRGAPAARPRPARPRPRLRVRRTRARRHRRRARPARQLEAAARRRAPARARLALAAARACGPMRPPRRARPPSCGRADKRHSIRRDARAVRHHYDLPPEFFALFLGESLTYSCALFTRGATTLEEAQEAEARPRLPQARPAAGPAGARRRLRLGQLRDPRGRAPRRPGDRHHAVRAAGRDRAPRGCASAASRTAWRSGWPTTASCATLRSTPSPASAWSSTWARARSTSTRSSWRASLRPGGRLLNHGIARMRMGDPEAGPFSERYVFPDGAPLHLSRMQLRRRARRARDGPRGGPARRLRRSRSPTGRARLDENLDEAITAGRARSACACGGSTCAPPGAASRAASSRSTRCRPADPAHQPRRSAWRPLRHRSARPCRRSRKRPARSLSRRRWPPHARPQARHRGRARRAR